MRTWGAVFVMVFVLSVGGSLSLCSLADTKASPGVIAARRQQEKKKFDAAGARRLLPRMEHQRIELLKRRVSLLQAQFQNADTGMITVHAAQQDLLNAQLAMTSTKKARIELLKEKVSIAKAIEELNEMRFREGTLSESNFLKSSAERLKTEITLLRESAANSE